jgi:hypothetical protein
MEAKDEPIRGLMEYMEEEGPKGDKVPNGWELTIEDLKALRFQRYTHDFGDGKGPKVRYKIFYKDKTYFTSAIVMNLLRGAANEPGLAKIRLNITGQGINTRYDLNKYLKG